MPTRDELRSRARNLRQNTTGAEYHLVRAIRKNRKNLGIRERINQQKTVGNMIVDIALPYRNLLIEVNGPAHAERGGRDERRCHYLRSLGFNVLMITNDEVLADVDCVIEKINQFDQSPREHEKYKDSLRVALRRARNSQSRDVSVEQMMEKGLEYYKKGEYFWAATELGKVIEKEPRNDKALYALALLSEIDGKNSEAVDYLKKAALFGNQRAREILARKNINFQP